MDFFRQIFKRFGEIDKEKKAGLYLTISFHLIVLIIFLAYSIHSQLKKETSFVLDFTQQEELERQMEIEKMKESVSEELDALLSSSATKAPRNVVVDASRPLKDDRNKNPQAVYDEAKELQRKLDAARREAESASDDKENVSLNEDKEEISKEAYQGPSVISYRLDGRKAMSLPIPAYKCFGGGDVSVAIIVNRKGYVVSTQIVESVSSPDECLRDYAQKAAKRSRFTASTSAPERQAGEIVYRFVAQ